MARRNRYDIDEELETPFNGRQFVRMLDYARPYARKLALTLIVMLLITALNLLTPLMITWTIDIAIPNSDIGLLVLISCALVLIIIISWVSIRWRMRTMNFVGQSIIHDIRLDMFRHLQRLPFDYFDSRPHGKILVRIVHYVNNVSDLLSGSLISAVVDLLSLAIILIYMLLMDPLLTLYAMIGLPFLFIGIFSIKSFQRRARRRLNASSSNVTAYTQESIQGMQITQLFGREAENRLIYRELNDEFGRRFMRTAHIDYLFWPMTDIISTTTVMILYGVVALWLRDRSGPQIEVGVIVGFIAYVHRFWAPITNLANFYSQLLNGASYIERIFEFLEEPEVIVNAPDAYPLPQIDGEVRFENVDFAYEKGKPILENVSFTAAPGDSIALVGPTGAGKSTVVNLISRFYDIDGGRITIDGHDIAKVQLDSLRGQMGIMLQDPFLFPTTIMENIRYGRLDASDEECIAAAKAVRAHDFIMRQPQGYETRIAERGAGVSAGERQLISFARVMLSQPRILILDEATASIDTRTEQALQQGLASLQRGRTSFVIAHRLSTIRDSTRILYIDDRGIAEEGTHEELLALNGRYAELHHTQIREMVGNLQEND